MRKILDFFRHPPEPVQIALWSFFIAFWILLIAGIGMGRQVELRFNFELQMIEIQIGPSVAQIPAQIEIIGGKMFVNQIPIRQWLEQQGFQIAWDAEEQTAIAVPK